MLIKNMLYCVMIILFIGCSKDGASDSPSPLIGSWKLTNQVGYDAINCTGAYIEMDFTQDLTALLGFNMEFLWTANSDGTLETEMTATVGVISQSETQTGNWVDNGTNVCITYNDDDDDTSDCEDCEDYVISGNNLTMTEICSDGCTISTLVKQ